MIETWFLLQSPAADAAFNMAVDEALLLTAEKRSRPLLRIYSWLKPSVSFGYFQKFPAHLAATCDIVRRPTGGGLVYHGDDTTYTVVVPPTHALHAMKTIDAYCAIHKAVAAAIGHESRITNHQSPISPRGQYECFQKPVSGDVVADGKKLAGAAQRRTKWGMLHQGSIAAKLPGEQLRKGFCGELAVTFERYELQNAERQLAGKLAREKYTADEWNHRVRLL